MNFHRFGGSAKKRHTQRRVLLKTVFVVGLLFPTHRNPNGNHCSGLFLGGGGGGVSIFDLKTNAIEYGMCQNWVPPPLQHGGLYFVPSKLKGYRGKQDTEYIYIYTPNGRQRGWMCFLSF